MRSADSSLTYPISAYQLCLCAGYLGSLVVNCSSAVGMPATQASWHQLPWGPCSLRCSAGVQQRTVECLASNGTVLNAHQCPGEVPATSQACNTQPCNLVLWKVRGTRDSQPVRSAVTNLSWSKHQQHLLHVSAGWRIWWLQFHLRRWHHVACCYLQRREQHCSRQPVLNAAQVRLSIAALVLGYMLTLQPGAVLL